MKSIKYRLWALPISDETIDVADASEFSRIGEGRVLIYSDEPKKRIHLDAEEIKDGESTEVLSDAEKGWLERCNMTILERFAKQHRLPLDKTIPMFLEALEKELRRAKDAEETEQHGEKAEDSQI